MEMSFDTAEAVHEFRATYHPGAEHLPALSELDADEAYFDPAAGVYIAVTDNGERDEDHAIYVQVKSASSLLYDHEFAGSFEDAPARPADPVARQALYEQGLSELARMVQSGLDLQGNIRTFPEHLADTELHLRSCMGMINLLRKHWHRQSEH